MASVCKLQLLLSDAFFFFNLRISCSFMYIYKPSLCILTNKHGYILSIEMVFVKEKKQKGIKEKAKEELFGEI